MYKAFCATIQSSSNSAFHWAHQSIENWGGGGAWNMFTMVLYGTHEQGLVMEPRFTEFPYETHEKGLHSTSCLKLEMHKLIGW